MSFENFVQWLSQQYEWPKDPYEILGVLSGLLCVWLYVRQNIWTWPIGIVNNLITIVLCLQKKLYADLGLQVLYIILSFYGWYEWLYGGRDKTPLPVSRTPLLMWPVLAFIGATLTFDISFLLQRFTDSDVPYWDAGVTSICLIAQWMITKKWLENWFVWIAGNIMFFSLYHHKGLFHYRDLQIVFIVLSVMGFLAWKKDLERAQCDQQVSTAPDSSSENSCPLTAGTNT